MREELRKYLIAATLAHQVHDGRGADDTTLPGAAANTVVFRLSVSDAQEVAAALKVRRHSGEGEKP